MPKTQKTTKTPQTKDTKTLHSPKGIDPKVCGHHVAQCLLKDYSKKQPNRPGIRHTKARKSGWQHYPMILRPQRVIRMDMAGKMIGSRFGKPGFRIQISTHQDCQQFLLVTYMNWDILPHQVPRFVNHGLLDEMKALEIKIAFITQDEGVAVFLLSRPDKNSQRLLRMIIPGICDVARPWLDAPSGVTHGSGSLLNPKTGRIVEYQSALNWLGSWECAYHRKLPEMVIKKILRRARERNDLRKGKHAFDSFIPQQHPYENPDVIEALSYVLARQHRSHRDSREKLASVLRGIMSHFSNQYSYLPVRRAASVYECGKTFTAEAIRILRQCGILEQYQPATWNLAKKKGKAALYTMNMEQAVAFLEQRSESVLIDID